MSDTPNPNDAPGPDDSADRPLERPKRRGRRARRAALISVIAVFVIACATAVGGYVALNHLAVPNAVSPFGGHIR